MSDAPAAMSDGTRAAPANLLPPQQRQSNSKFACSRAPDCAIRRTSNCACVRPGRGTAHPGESAGGPAASHALFPICFLAERSWVSRGHGIPINRNDCTSTLGTAATLGGKREIPPSRQSGGPSQRGVRSLSVQFDLANSMDEAPLASPGRRSATVASASQPAPRTFQVGIPTKCSCSAT